jgi:hypothetical protein
MTTPALFGFREAPAAENLQGMTADAKHFFEAGLQTASWRHIQESFEEEFPGTQERMIHPALEKCLPLR